MKCKGFTLIELMIVLAIIGILVSAVAGHIQKPNPNLSTGAMGTVETRCISGYKYVVTSAGAQQVLSEVGKGVSCE